MTDEERKAFNQLDYDFVGVKVEDKQKALWIILKFLRRKAGK